MLQSYESAAWYKMQSVIARYTQPSPSLPRGEGDVLGKAKAEALATLRAEVPPQLAKWDGSWRASPWFSLLQDLAQSKGIPLVVVAPPVSSSFRELLETPAGGRATQWFASELALRGNYYVDLTNLVPDEGFLDAVHCNPVGAREFSRALAQRVHSALPGR